MQVTCRARTAASGPAGPLVGRLLLLGLVTLCVCGRGGRADGQISSQQMKQRYEKDTKGTSIEDFVKRLESDDPEKRLEAVKSLGASKDNKAVEYLIQALGDSDVRVQAKALDMLGDMRATDATPVLIQHLFLRTTDVQMKQRILAALGKIGDPRAARPIMEFLQRDLDPATRGTAIFALGDIGSPESVDTLSQIAQADPDPIVRRLASEAKSKVEQHQAVMKNEVKGPSETFLAPKEPQQAPQ
ncbi:MAG TPA: HEAT repeat domain-containing protein [Candidatus Acidoferrales bacterium]|nr:HEAT repeat domain-containing protein [Candidatus Acidoferrales bacterium]